MTNNSKASVLWVALSYYIGFLLLWSISHELSDMRVVRYPLYFAWEADIEFQRWALPLYFSLDIAVILFPFLFTSWRNAIAPVGTLFAQTAIAAIFFVLVPIEPGYETTGVWGPYFYEYFGLENLSRWNHAPSLHVSYVFTMAWIIGKRHSKTILATTLTWAVAVSLSTILVHEHHLLCVLSGVALFVFTMVSVYPALQRKYNDSTPDTLPHNIT
ncbi:MAG: phosphatase PAP2 family protein [Phycisphaerales bacterium]|nr:phosphatase PAP2 family protein [Phycisphaerales bacterium]